MIERCILIMLDAKPNRHSLNALLGALETDRTLDRLGLRLAANEDQLGHHLAESLSAGQRPIVGLSFTTPQLGRMRDMLRRLTEQFGDAARVRWVAGGPHPTADPEGTLRLGFDVVVRGEGEATLLDLLHTLAARDDLAEVDELAALPGIAFRRGTGDVQFTGRRPPIDLDAFPPFPLWRRRVVGPIEITRGCPFACGYCQTSHLLGTQPRHRSIETIARYAGLIRERNLRDVRVITPNAFSYGSPDGRTLNLPALESLLATLRHTLGAHGRLFFGTFPSEVRPEHVADATLELVKRYANNDNLVIGAQSGSQRMLEHCGRGHRVDDIFSAVSRTLAAGLKPLVDFIFGLPGETREDLQSTIDVIRELAAMGALIHAHTFLPLPQTRFADEPAGRIHGRLRPVLKELIRNGTLFGVWT
ncbi:MAG: TIGR04013 family B12-binding domain/radical SAM domain-containing protein [Planctomycetota bacterium]|nr:TIGR04013 family B12-binding domain/radical SAM domain-containing protein [Planctomycetota bacterium]